MSDRFSQCTETCTTDCGHCKGRPVEALRADNERLARRLAARFEETEKLRIEAEGLRQELDEARANCEHCGDMRSHLSAVEADRDDARAERDRVRTLASEIDYALRMLVNLKDGPRDEAYAQDKPTAWQLARDAVAAVDAFRSSTPDAEPAPGGKQ